MKRIFKAKAIILLISLSFFSSSLCASADSTENSEIKILVLLSFHDLLPWTESFKLGLKEARSKYGKRIQFYTENMDMQRLTKSLSDAEWAAYLSKKYQAVQFDAAIADSNKASLFLRQYGRQLLGDIPHVYHSVTHIEGSPLSKALKLQFGDAIEKTLQMALQQNNHAEQIVIVGGQNRMTRNILNILLPLIEKHSTLKVTILQDHSVAELQEKLSALSKNSVVFYGLLFKDKTGKKLVPKEVLATIAKNSNAPIYSFSSSMLGTGMVGGHLLDGATSAFQATNAVMDYLEEGAFKKTYATLKTIIDWQALTKYGIDTKSIEEDAIITNKPVSLLERYSKEVMLAIMTAMIFILLITWYWTRKLSRLNSELAIANAELLTAKNTADRLARTDHLSGMNNRRAFFDKSEQILLEAKRGKKPFSLLMLDIDHFKKVNDNYGHAVGDQIIKNIAQTIEQVKREMDISARFGGEEFILLSPSTDLRGAAKLAARIRVAIENSIHKFTVDEINITVSIGVFSVVAHSGFYSLKDYIKYADDALYQAKEQGRNCVVLSEHCLCWAVKNSPKYHLRVS